MRLKAKNGPLKNNVNQTAKNTKFLCISSEVNLKTSHSPVVTHLLPDTSLRSLVLGLLVHLQPPPFFGLLFSLSYKNRLQLDASTISNSKSIINKILSRYIYIDISLGKRKH